MRISPPQFPDATALVLFSGGQDSSVCLAWALHNFGQVETIGFDYGQRHRVELDCRGRLLEGVRQSFPEWREKLGPDHMTDLGVLGKISETALTRDREIILSDKGLPSTFVPGRNLMFLTVAAAVGYRRGLFDLVGGMCETDYSGYPDCRDETIKAMERALCLGLDTDFHLHTPLMRIDKAATWEMAEALGGTALVDLIIEDSHSCYRGERARRHEWGYGCGACPACALRARGYFQYRSRT